MKTGLKRFFLLLLFCGAFIFTSSNAQAASHALWFRRATLEADTPVSASARPAGGGAVCADDLFILRSDDGGFHHAFLRPRSSRKEDSIHLLLVLPTLPTP